jgi:hypothetical protein
VKAYVGSNPTPRTKAFAKSDVIRRVFGVAEVTEFPNAITVFRNAQAVCFKQSELPMQSFGFDSQAVAENAAVICIEAFRSFEELELNFAQQVRSLRVLKPC